MTLKKIMTCRVLVIFFVSLFIKLYGTENYSNKIERDYSLGQNAHVAEFFRSCLNGDFLEVLSEKTREKRNKNFLISSKILSQFRKWKIPILIDMPDMKIGFGDEHDMLKKLLEEIDETEFNKNYSELMIVVINAQVNKIMCLGESDDLVGMMVLTTQDHESDVKSKCKRIKDRGGHILWGRVVNGGLAVSRTIGYRGFKGGREVDAREGNIQDGDILIFACDGVWDVMKHEEVAVLVQEKFNEYNEEYLAVHSSARNTGEKIGKEDGNKQLNLVAKALQVRAYEKGSTGDISVLIFRPPVLEIVSIEEAGFSIEDELEEMRESFTASVHLSIP